MKNTMRFVSCNAFVLAALLAAGCQSAGPKTTTGAVTGGLIGAAAGGIIGHQSGRGLEGAAIGAGVGALGGGLIGHQFDKEAIKTNPNHLSLTRVAEMGKQGAPDSVIIDEIRSTNSVYSLDSETISYLKNNGVGDKVIDYMLTTRR